jgi:pimeloyl-ACP methyl ester carboxylesterase
MAHVLIHGNPETDAIWGPLAAALRERGVDDLVLLSPPGFGAPVPAGWDATRVGYRDWLIAELEGLDGGAHVLGHDWGAGHVYGLVAERPDLVASWAADCAGLLHPDYVWHDAAQAWQTPGVGEEAVAAMVALPHADRVGLFAGLGIPAEVADALARAIDDTMARCILALYRSAAQPAVRELGVALEAAEPRPGLVIVATEDPYAGTPAMAADTARRTGAATSVLEGAGHWWMLDQPGPAADALAAFWASV